MVHLKINKKAHILLVDDDSTYLGLLSKTLNPTFDIKTCGSSIEARNLLPDHDFDLVISDYKMPAEDGISFWHWIKQAYEHIPFILISGFGSKKLAMDAIKSRMFDLIEKPFSLETLLDSIERALLEKRKRAHLIAENDQTKFRAETIAMQKIELDTCKAKIQDFEASQPILDAKELIHEIANHLSVVCLSLGVLARESEKSERFKTSLAKCLMACQTASTIIQENQGPIPVINRLEIDLNNVLIDSLSQLDPLIKELEIRVELMLHGTPIYIRGSEAYLQSIFVNLIKNSCQAFRHSSIIGPKVIKIESSTPKHLKCQIQVEDNAGGIPKSIKDSIFEKHITTKQDKEGSGLGLSICQKYMSLHNGTIIAESDVERGSTIFTLSFLEDILNDRKP